jgi:uroporphyrin-III C-methyltransferase/precorrin-2 dehydrogenase/sirohydrochlorin ferrochelatase
VRFITGHLKEGHSNISFPELLDPKQTLVFYMALVALPEICQRLIDNGRNKNTPAALIAKGTTKEQQVIVSDLEKLPQVVGEHHVHAPTLVIIGDVVKLHKKLKWFNTEHDLKAID